MEEEAFRIDVGVSVTTARAKNRHDSSWFDVEVHVLSRVASLDFRSCVEQARRHRAVCLSWPCRSLLNWVALVFAAGRSRWRRRGRCFRRRAAALPIKPLQQLVLRVQHAPAILDEDRSVTGLPFAFEGSPRTVPEPRSLRGRQQIFFAHRFDVCAQTRYFSLGETTFDRHSALPTEITRGVGLANAASCR
jgi:hypothetical protein